MNIRIYALTIFCMLSGFERTASAADTIAVIVNKNSAVHKLTLAQVKAIFLGETRYADSSVLLEVHDRNSKSELYTHFFAGIASMNPKEVAVHWAKKVFTGEAAPISRILGDDAEAIALIIAKPNAITYIQEKNATNKVKVVFVVRY